MGTGSGALHGMFYISASPRFQMTLWGKQLILDPVARRSDRENRDRPNFATVFGVQTRFLTSPKDNDGPKLL